MRHDRHRYLRDVQPKHVGLLTLRSIDSLTAPTSRPVLLLMMSKTVARTLLSDGLVQAGYDVHLVESESELFTTFEEIALDLILLPIGLPGSDAFHLCAKLREVSSIPIILMAEQKIPSDVIRGLTLGADDYVTTPITFAELDARLSATLRRAGHRKYRHKSAANSYTSIILNEVRRTARIDNQEIQLTQIEFRILSYLLNHANTPVSKDKLIEAVWGFTELEEFNFIEVAIRRLRQKIEADPSKPEYLITVRGLGYQLKVC